MVKAPAISHNVTFTELMRATMAAITASENSRILNAGRTSSGSSQRIIRNAGAAISMLNSASRQNDCCEGAFLFIQLALDAIICSPGHKGILDRAGAVDLPNTLLPLNDFAEVSPIILCRTRLSPPTFHLRNNAGSHHDNNDDGGQRLHRGQRFVPVVPKLEHAPVSVENAPATDKIPLSKDRSSATKNAMLRFAARVLIARQHDLCRTDIEASRKAPSRSIGRWLQ